MLRRPSNTTTVLLTQCAPVFYTPRAGRPLKAATQPSKSSAFALLAESATATTTPVRILYRQGGVNLVVNHDREGFAHSFNTLHGPSVCAIALDVDSVKAAQERAAAFSAPTYVGRIGPGEASIPAVGGVEGSLIYFIDESGATPWRNDFEPIAGAKAGEALRAVDHLSNVVRRGEFLTGSLFYKTILGFRTEPAVEIADPHGAFYSRSLRSPNGAVRIPLNISDGGATGVTRFI